MADNQGKAWWEWIALAMGIWGGIKAMLYVIDRVLNKPKLRGDIERVERRPDNIEQAVEGFPQHLFVYVYAYNARGQYTTVRRWSAVIRSRSAQITIHSTPVPRLSLAWGEVTRHAETNKQEIMEETHRVKRFEWRSGIEGWLHFPVTEATGVALDEDSTLEIVALDAEGRTHTLKPYKLLAGILIEQALSWPANPAD